MTGMEQRVSVQRDSVLLNIVASGLICMLWTYDWARTLRRRVVHWGPSLLKQ